MLIYIQCTTEKEYLRSSCLFAGFGVDFSLLPLPSAEKAFICPQKEERLRERGKAGLRYSCSQRERRGVGGGGYEFQRHQRKRGFLSLFLLEHTCQGQSPKADFSPPTILPWPLSGRTPQSKIRTIKKNLNEP